MRIKRCLTIQPGTDGMLDVHVEERLYVTEDDPRAKDPIRVLLLAYVDRCRVTLAALRGTDDREWRWLHEDLTRAAEGGRPLTIIRH